MKRFISILVVSLGLTGCGNYNPLAVLQFAPSESDSSNDETSGNSGAGAGIGNNQVPPPLYTIESLVSVKGETTGLAANDNFLFWSNEKGLWRSDLNGTDPQILVSNLTQPEGFIVNENALYWVEQRTPLKQVLQRMPLEGFHPITLRQAESAGEMRGTLVGDKEAIYWVVPVEVEGSGFFSFAIERVALDGTVTTLYITSERIWALGGDQTFIYWFEAVPNSGAKLSRILKSGGTPEVLAENTPLPATNMIVSSEGIFSGTSGMIFRIPIGGGPVEILENGRMFEPRNLVLYQEKLYWFDYSPIDYTEIRILSVPVTGEDFSVVAEHLRFPGQLVAIETGLYWGEDDPAATGFNRYRNWQHLAWDSQTPHTLASDLFVTAVDVANDRFYFSEYNAYSGFAQLTSLPVVGGDIEPVFVGSNGSGAFLTPDDGRLFFIDGSTIKRVPIEGGRAKTIGHNGQMLWNRLFVSEGWVYVSTYNSLPFHIFKVPAEGGELISLNEQFDAYGELLAVQNGYVYFRFRRGSDPFNRGLYRIPAVGGPPERILVLGENHEILGFEAPTTVYYSNELRQMFKYDLVTEQNQMLGHVGFGFLGFNASYVYVRWSTTSSVSRIPKNGSGTSELVWGVGNPFSMTGWVLSGEEIYFSTSQLTHTGVVSEIGRLRPFGT